MKVGWQIKKLRDVCNIDKLQGVYIALPYVGLENIESHTARFIGSTEPQSVKSATFRFSSEHVLYGRLRPYLNKAIAPEFDGHCSTEIFPLKPCPQLLREYLLYWLLSDSTMNLINNTCTGARMPRADMNEVLDFNFPIPPLPEQKRIVRILDEAFEGIVTAKANAEKNLQNARAIFESHLQSVFTKRGEGWKRVRIEEACTSIIDCVNKTAPKVVGPTPFKMIRTANVRNGHLHLESVYYVTEEAYRIWTRRQIPMIGDVILTREAPMGEVGMLLSDDKVFLGQRLVSYRADLAKLDNRFLLYSFQSDYMQDQIRALASGSTVQHMRVPDSKKLQIYLPSLSTQQAIVGRLDSLREETRRLVAIYQRKLSALDEFKKSLLQRAFTGGL
jgi:type I restriction enzyme, S subunit